MQKEKIIFRADGSPSIGMGHFTRTLALAEMLKDDFYLTYATRQPTPHQVSEINRICHKVFPLPEDDSHFDIFLSELKGDEIVVLDNYYFDTAYQRKIKEKGCKLVCIDDMHDKHYVADVVINHAEGIDDSMFSKEDYTQLLTGFRYALLRGPFFQTHNSSEEKKIDLLIGIGGADPKDITAKIVNEILKLKVDLKIAVLVGNAYQGKINQNEYPNVEVYNNLDATEVANLMGASSLGLFPASSIAIEAIAMRLPFLVGYFVENQKDLYEGILSKKLAIGIGHFNLIKKDNLIAKIELLLNDPKMQEQIRGRQSLVLDGNSPDRFRKIFKELN